MKTFIRLPRAGAFVAALILFLTVGVSGVQAQTASATPDSFVVQITNVTPNTRIASVNGMSGDGRFVVMESTANLAPADPARPDTVEPNNADGNREIFLFDYAQRRIFQITNTKHALKDATKPATDNDNIEVEVSNNRPFISRNGRWIVFSSNAYADGNGAASPKSFNGSDNRAALKADGNQEVFLYRIPDVPTVDLSIGAEQPFVNLADGALTRVTSTTNVIKPQPGSGTGTSAVPPTAVDDNRFATLNDDGSFVAFVSTRNLPTVNGLANADLNSEIYIYNRSTGAFSQVTNTANPANSLINTIWNANPSLSGTGAVVSFISSAEIPGAGPAEAAGARGNGEVYFARFNGAAVTDISQVTRTPVDLRGSTILLSPGQRLSRDGNLILFESTADIQASGSVSGDVRNSGAIYLYNIGAGSFTQITPRPAADQTDLSRRYPTFTGDGGTIVFASTLNFRADGQISTSTTEGLNPNRRVQIFAVSVAAPTSFARLTNTPNFGFAAELQPYPGNTIRRIAFGFSSGEFGGGNSDNSSEAYYLVVPNVVSETPAPSPWPISYATGATDRPVVAASPAPTPGAVTGLAPGMLSIGRATSVALAPSNQEVEKNNAQENQRRPPLPVELNGVSVAVNNAAAGLYFVSPRQLNFVVPPGLVAGSYPVVVYNNGAVIRSSVQINAAQPDIFSSTNGAGGRAAVLNVTNPLAQTAEPFSVTTTRPKADGSGTETVPTELLIMLTGVRNVQRTAVTVRIGTTDLTGDAIVSVGPSLTSGFDQIVVRLPASLAGAGDVPIIVSVAAGGQTFASLPAETAPRIQIN